MADPAVITGIVLAATSIVTAATPLAIARRRTLRDEEKAAEALARASVQDWTALNEALNREISRLHDDLNRLRDDYDAQLGRLRADYEAQLSAAGRKITDLQAEVAALRRLLGKPGGP